MSETSLDEGRVIMGPSLDEGRVIMGPTRAVDRDPVCGMEVAPDSPIRAQYEGQTYAFCSEECRQKFEAQPAAFVKPVSDRSSNAIR